MHEIKWLLLPVTQDIQRLTRKGKLWTMYSYEGRQRGLKQIKSEIYKFEEEQGADFGNFTVKFTRIFKGKNDSSKNLVYCRNYYSH